MADLRTLATASLMSDTRTMCNRGHWRFVSEERTQPYAYRNSPPGWRCSPLPHRPRLPFSPGLLDMTLKPSCRTMVRPTALMRRDLPIVVCPGTTTGKSALTSAFGPRFLRLGQRRRARGTYRPGSAHRWRYQLTRSFAPATASHRVDRICRVAVRGDRQRIGNGGCRGSAEGFSRV